MGISIKQEFFGKTVDNEDVYKYTFVGGKIEVSVLNYGGAISNIYVPDKNGKVEDIALGYDDVAGYEDNFPYIGVIVGRVAGRIAGGKFRLDDQDYQLVINNGPNNIHGGIKGFSRRVWDAVVDSDKLVLTYKSPDEEEGFPGEITTTVVYTLTIDGCLNLEYTATSTKPCPFNLTNHSYFNLKGQESDDVFDHLVKINAEKCVPVDENLIPTGELANVEGTINDLRSLTLLRDREKDVREGSLDLTYCIGEEGQMKLASRVIHPQTGRFIDTYTTEAGLQFYTAKYMPKIKGKNGKIYQPFGSFCLETQRFPDSINHSNFPDCVLRPGQTYSQTTTFKFGVSMEKETQ